MLKTSSLTTVLVAILGAGFLHAQAPAPTADQLQTKIHRLEDQVARLQQLAGLCTQPMPLNQPGPTSGRPQTLGEAAAAAATVKHEWASINAVPRFDPSAQRAPVAVDAESASSMSAATTNAMPNLIVGPPEETYWKNRMRAFLVQLESDRAYQREARARVQSLAADLAATRGVLDAITVKRALFEAQTDLSRISAAVTNDARAVADLEIEAHRANVPPGWLVIK